MSFRSGRQLVAAGIGDDGCCGGNIHWHHPVAKAKAVGRGETQPSCLTVFGSVPYTSVCRPGRYSTHKRTKSMRIYTAVIERCTDTGLYVGFVPGFSGAHSQGETLDELNDNLKEVIALLLEDGEPRLETEFVGTQNVVVA
jgi:predicted RNase H-like HicB family nuclease